MASYIEPKIVSILSDYDFSAKQYYFCKIGSADNIVTLCGSGEKAIGIVMNKPTSGQVAEVALPGGGALIKTGEAIEVGKYICSTAAGIGEKANTAGDHVAAFSVEAGDSGDIISVLVTCFEAYNAEA